MADNQDLHLTTMYESTVKHPEIAGRMVRDWAVDSLGVPEDTVFYVVWFCFILGGWKALVSSTEADGRYYEVTHKPEHDGSDGPEATYIDTYVKTHNIKI